MLSNFINNKLYYRLTIKVLIYVFLFYTIAIGSLKYFV